MHALPKAVQLVPDSRDSRAPNTDTFDIGAVDGAVCVCEGRRRESRSGWTYYNFGAFYRFFLLGFFIVFFCY